MFGQLALLVPAGGVVVVDGVVVVAAGVVVVDVPDAALAIAVLPPAMTPVTARASSALRSGVCIGVNLLSVRWRIPRVDLAPLCMS